MVQRLSALVWCLIALALIVVAWDYQAPYSYEPVGPRAYPILLLALMAIGALVIVVKPDAFQPFEGMDRAIGIKIVAYLVLQLLLARLFIPLGFLVTGFIFLLPSSRLYGAKWRDAIIISVLIPIVLYVLFYMLLGISLPRGILDSLPF